LLHEKNDANVTLSADPKLLITHEKLRHESYAPEVMWHIIYQEEYYDLINRPTDDDFLQGCGAGTNVAPAPENSLALLRPKKVGSSSSSKAELSHKMAREPLFKKA